MTPNQARMMVLRAQLSHARLGLSAAAGNTPVAKEWLASVQEIERRLARLEAEDQEQVPAAA